MYSLLVSLPLVYIEHNHMHQSLLRCSLRSFDCCSVHPPQQPFSHPSSTMTTESFPPEVVQAPVGSLVVDRRLPPLPPERWKVDETGVRPTRGDAVGTEWWKRSEAILRCCSAAGPMMDRLPARHRTWQPADGIRMRCCGCCCTSPSSWPLVRGRKGFEASVYPGSWGLECTAHSSVA